MRLGNAYEQLPRDPQVLAIIDRARAMLRAVGVRVTRHQIWQTLVRRAKDEVKEKRRGKR